MSSTPDVSAMAIDASNINISSFFSYSFLPFSAIGIFLAKMELEEATGILIVPNRTNDNQITTSNKIKEKHDHLTHNRSPSSADQKLASLVLLVSVKKLRR